VLQRAVAMLLEPIYEQDFKYPAVSESRTPDIDPAIPCYFRAFSVF
jgi:hypothetical protein